MGNERRLPADRRAALRLLHRASGRDTGIISESARALGDRLPGRHAGRLQVSMLAALSDPDFLPLGRCGRAARFGFLDRAARRLGGRPGHPDASIRSGSPTSRILRTAVDQRSVIELARLVGYSHRRASGPRLRRLHASSAPGSPDNVLIPAGSRVQSVPGPGQTPQVFETSTDLTARSPTTRCRPQTTLPWAARSRRHQHVDRRHRQQHQRR